MWPGLVQSVSAHDMLEELQLDDFEGALQPKPFSESMNQDVADSS